MTLRLVHDGEGADSEESRPKSLNEMRDREAMAAALPYLRRLSHCSGLPDGSQIAAQLLARSLERRLDPRFGGRA